MVSLTGSLWSPPIDPPSMLTYSLITTKPSSLTLSDLSDGSIERTTDPVSVASKGRIDSVVVIAVVSVVLDVVVSLSWIPLAPAPFSPCSSLSRRVAVGSSLAGSRLGSVWDVTAASVGAMVALMVNAGEVAITDDEEEGEGEREGEEREERG